MWQDNSCAVHVEVTPSSVRCEHTKLRNDFSIMKNSSPHFRHRFATDSPGMPHMLESESCAFFEFEVL